MRNLAVLALATFAIPVGRTKIMIPSMITTNTIQGILLSKASENSAEKFPDSYICEDCGQFVSPSAYPYHNSDHTLRRIPHFCHEWFVIWQRIPAQKIRKFGSFQLTFASIRKDALVGIVQTATHSTLDSIIQNAITGAEILTANLPQPVPTDTIQKRMREFERSRKSEEWTCEAIYF